MITRLRGVHVFVHALDDEPVVADEVGQDTAHGTRSVRFFLLAIGKGEAGARS